MVHPITLSLLAVSGLAVAAGAVATEIERETIDLVLTRPVGRGPFLLGKAAAAIVMVAATEIGGFVGLLVARLTVRRIDEIPLSSAARAFAGSWALFVALAMVGILISARSSLRGRALGVCVGLIVGWFFLNFIALLINGISGLRFASPFHYFRPGEILVGGGVAQDFVTLSAVAIVALGVASWTFGRRDLTR